VATDHRKGSLGTLKNPVRDLRSYLEANADVVTHIGRPVHLDDVGALAAQSDRPIVFENIIERPGFRLCDSLVKTRAMHGRTLGVAPEDFCKTLAARIRRPPRPTVVSERGPVKEVVLTGTEVDLGRLPVAYHTDRDDVPFLTGMCIIKDPETGFLNTSHPLSRVEGPRRCTSSFFTPHANAVMAKYRAMGAHEMPMAMCIGLHPAYEIVGNFSGLHMDMWGEIDMIGAVMEQDVELTRCETIDLLVPAHAEIVIEGMVNLVDRFSARQSGGPVPYFIPGTTNNPEWNITAITMRRDRPIYRNHQMVPSATDHQRLFLLCHEAVLYNRLAESGLDVRDVQFPVWGGTLTVLLQFDYPRPGMVNDALMLVMGSPWPQTKVVIAVSPDTDINDPEAVFLAVASRCDPSRDMILVPNCKAYRFDPSAELLPNHYPQRIVGKIGIDATVKERYNKADFELAWPRNWGKVFLKDYL